jgi:hypothetical protein
MNPGCPEDDAGALTPKAQHSTLADWCSGNTQHLNSGGTRTEFHAGCQLHLLRLGVTHFSICST